MQPFDPDGSQHTLKCSPAALDPRCSCWQRAAVVPPVTQPCSGAALYALACKYQTQLKPRKYSIGLLTSSTYTLYLVVGSIKPQTNIGVVRRRASHQASHIRKHTPRPTSAAVLRGESSVGRSAGARPVRKDGGEAGGARPPSRRASQARRSAPLPRDRDGKPLGEAGLLLECARLGFELARLDSQRLGLGVGVGVIVGVGVGGRVGVG